MPRDAGVYLEDILIAVARIREYTRDLDYPAFQRDSRTVDAVVRNLEIIGEAAKQVPIELRERAPEIELQRR